MLEEFLYNFIFEIAKIISLLIVSFAIITSISTLLIMYCKDKIKRMLSSMTTLFKRRDHSPIEDKEENEDSNEDSDPIEYDSEDLSFLFNNGVVFDVKDEHDADHVGYQTEFPEWEITDPYPINENDKDVFFNQNQYSLDRSFDDNDITGDMP